MRPLVRRYDVSGDYDERTLRASVEAVQGMLKSGRRINVNDAMLLYGGYACAAAGGAGAEKAGRRGMAEELRALLSEEQVMIGVPDMLNRVDVRVYSGGGGGSGGSGGADKGGSGADGGNAIGRAGFSIDVTVERPVRLSGGGRHSSAIRRQLHEDDAV